MNCINFTKGNKEYYIMVNDNELPNELKKIEKENDIIEVTIDGFLIEDYKWILNYTNDNWIDEYCKRLKKHEGIRF